MSEGTDLLSRLRALQSPETRSHLEIMQRVKSRFLRLDRFDELATRFQELLDELTLVADPTLPCVDGNRREGGVIIVTGESGAGKTHAVKRMIGRHPAFPEFGVKRSGCPAVYVRVPSACSSKALSRITLRRLGMPLANNPPAHIVWEKVADRIENRILVLPFDEFQNVIQTATDYEIVEIRNLIKTLVTSPDWPIILILIGSPDIVKFVQPIAEVRRRCRYVAFEPMKLPDDLPIVGEMISDLAAIAGLTPKITAHDALEPRLVHASLYQFGILIELVQKAIEVTLKSGTSELTPECFAQGYAIRTSCLPSDNPFVARDWTATDCTKVLDAGTLRLPGEDEDDDGASLFPSTPRRKAGQNRKRRS